MRLRTVPSMLALLLPAVVMAQEYSDPDALTRPQVLELHDSLLSLDTHVDIGPGHGTRDLDPGGLNLAQVNLPSMRVGGLDAGFFIVYTPQGNLDKAGYAKAVADAEEKYRGIVRMLRGYRDEIRLATTADEVEATVAEGKLVALIGIENSYPLGKSEDVMAKRVAKWAERGARYASITHFGHNQFGGSSNPSLDRDKGSDPGLKDLGRALVAELNDHGIMVDISHVGPQTAAEAMDASRAPVIASHSTVKAVYDNPRGLTDKQLEAIRNDGGVAQITAFRSYLAPTDEQLERNIKALQERLGLVSSADRQTASGATLEEYSTELRRIRQEGQGCQSGSVHRACRARHRSGRRGSCRALG